MSKDDVISQYFKDMTAAQNQTDPSTRYIKPWTLFPKERQGADDAKEWIEKKFQVKVSFFTL